MGQGSKNLYIPLWVVNLFFLRSQGILQKNSRDKIYNVIDFKGDSGSPVVQYSGGRALLVGVLEGGDTPDGCQLPNDLKGDSWLVRVIYWIVNTINEYN